MSKNSQGNNQQQAQEKPDGKIPGADGAEVAKVEEKGAVADSPFRIAVSLAEILKDGTVNPKVVEDKLLAAKFHDQVPAALQSRQVSHSAIEGYIKHALDHEIALETCWFVIADPEVDPTLKSINFFRGMSGLPPTFFYPSFAEPTKAEDKAE